MNKRKHSTKAHVYVIVDYFTVPHPLSNTYFRIEGVYGNKLHAEKRVRKLPSKALAPENIIMGDLFYVGEMSHTYHILKFTIKDSTKISLWNSAFLIHSSKGEA